ncbi:glycosyltransferase family 2 protein [Deinococcus cellulosilyticus]|uniref:Glycosyl transferase n=1 Tax=Deinococcus cellulosilyticus (strain DSM 18568 / NBRC 106333 / KACC 11606 / 5516J-15) TaxID=1223518 RepID=A0A511MVP4_DEIC1|nr:glycosyltransferase family 2 protein [Deinococcus cellulosilyticus]GEM44659.1 glycosyl transferase [Deinococcus cellulosilyticus NBRC 106333 = KACC 11606]
MENSFQATLLHIIEVLIITYFAILNSVYAVSVLVASRVMVATALRGERVLMKSYLEKGYYRPISLLVPAFNEEETITASVHSFLNLHYPEFEVIVINDGSQDNTLQKLMDEFMLENTSEFPSRVLESKPIRGLYRSIKYPNLLVIDKENGGKADALNAGIIHSTKPLFCSVDADSILEARALIRVSRQFLEDDRLVAVGGTVRVLNGAVIREDAIKEVHSPKSWLERIQVVEYTRAFLAGRSTFSALQVLLIISGAFGLFSRNAVIEVGGYRTDTVGEDMELVVRMHRYMRDRKRKYQIRYTMDPICWTQVPSDMGMLRKQRNRWQRGLLETLWTHRGMFLNPRYGRIGLFSMPYYLLFEALAPLLEVFGYVFTLYLLLTRQLNVDFAIMFLVMALLYGTLVSMASIGIEGFMIKRYTRFFDRVKIMLATVFEQLGYRQVLAFERLFAFVMLYSKKGQWDIQRRARIQR